MVPSMLGIILLVAGIFVLLDMFVLLPYIDAIVAREGSVIYACYSVLLPLTAVLTSTILPTALSLSKLP